MDLASTLEGDWEVVDDVRTVSYLSRCGPSHFGPAVEVTDALRRAADKDDLARSPEPLARKQVAWHLWAAKLGGVTPKTTDVIVDDAGKRWTVYGVGVMDEGKRYRLACLQER